MKIRLGVVGVGWAGQRQIKAVRELNDKVTVSAIMDNDAQHLRSVSHEFGINKTYTRYQDLLADEAIDAVSICTPHQSHAKMAIDATSAGKHVLVEKPMATTVNDATQMIEAAESNHVKLYVAENWAYSPITRFLQKVVHTSEHIGELTAASYVSGFQAKDFGYAGRRAWLTQPELGGTGTWMLHGIHSVARIRQIFGEIDEVYLQNHHNSTFTRPDIEATLSGLFTLTNGVHLSVLQSCELRLKGNVGGITIHGDKGSIRAGETGYQFFPVADNTNDMPVIQPYPDSSLSDYALELDAFADYVTHNREGPTTGYSERRTLAVVLAGYESMKMNQPISTKHQFGDL